MQRICVNLMKPDKNQNKIQLSPYRNEKENDHYCHSKIFAFIYCTAFV